MPRPGSRRLPRCLLLASALVFFAVPLASANPEGEGGSPQAHQAIDDTPRYIAQIELHTKEEIADLFGRASALLEEGESFRLGHPITFVLHGPEVRYFARRNYGQHKALVNQAAQLDAFNLIDIRVCASYLHANMISADELPPFVQVVPYGPEEESRLKREGFIEF